METLPTIAVTEGDPAGIGPEVIARALEGWPGAERCRVVVLGYPNHFLPHRKDSGDSFVSIGDLGGLAPDAGIVWADPGGEAGLGEPVRPGQENPAGSRAAMRALDVAIELALSGEAHAICTGPIHKANLARVGYEFPGHTELLAARANVGDGFAMLMCGAGLRVVPATIHEPLARVPGLLKLEKLTALFALLDANMLDFGFAKPRIGVCGLNPHAGEGGRFGREEIEIIEPAVEAARADGILAEGPYPADSLFHRALAGEFDVVVAMYHDQALIPIKTLDFHGGVNVTLGLPFVRTSPDHGTAYDIAGQGIANPSSTIAALDMALSLAEARMRRRVGEAGATR